MVVMEKRIVSEMLDSWSIVLNAGRWDLVSGLVFAVRSPLILSGHSQAVWSATSGKIPSGVDMANICRD